MRIVVALVRAYQYLISPLLPPMCRFAPSCSDYCIAAVVGHGTWRGLFLTLRRLLRCHPASTGGYDPV